MTVARAVPIGTHPFGIGVAPAGARVYVADNDFSGGSVLVFDSAGTLAGGLSLGPGFLVGLAVDPAAGRVYVADSTFNQVAVVDATASAVLTTVPVGRSPSGVAVNPAGTRVYVANTDDGTVSVIDTASNTVVDTVYVGGGPVAFGQFIGPENVPFTPPAPMPTNTPTPSPSPSPAPCIGDCDASATVSVDEVVTMVNIALGSGALSACQAGDTNSDGTITVDEILAAVNNVLHGCPPLSASAETR